MSLFDIGYLNPPHPHRILAIFFLFVASGGYPRAGIIKYPLINHYNIIRLQQVIYYPDSKNGSFYYPIDEYYPNTIWILSHVIGSQINEIGQYFRNG